MKPKLILLINGNEEIKTLVLSCLKFKAAWEILLVLDDIEVMTLAEIKQPDLILLEVMISEFDGMEILEELQNNSKTSHIPIIFITAKAQASDRCRFYRAGAKGVINKPFNSITLTSQISGFLGWEL